MGKAEKKPNYAYFGLRLSIVCLFTAGFIYQTMQFFYLYWTYPTVVDIQESSPTYLEVPSFTFCNKVGYRFENLCKKFSFNPCISKRFVGQLLQQVVCRQFPEVCDNGEYPKNYKTILYHKLMTRHAFTRDDFPLLGMSLEEYLTCTIDIAGQSTPCDMENVLGTVYGTEDLPQFCYTIYSKWGNPNRTIAKIPRGATMKFHLFLNSSRRYQPPEVYETKDFLPPVYNPPADVTVQIAAHSPYFLPNPYFGGHAFVGGKNYEMRIKLIESHLLPAPYQTNCTDYMKIWYERGGKGPINQLTTVQECRINKTYEKISCIPVKMNYPHPYNICKSCDEEQINCPWFEPDNNCTLLAGSYNQPCDSMEYIVNKQDKAISIFERDTSPGAESTDGLRRTLIQHACEGRKRFGPDCATINITVPFDRFVITNYSYNAKYEPLELFSVVGGYMGMWLGVSLVTVFDVISDGVAMIRTHFIKKKQSTLRERKGKIQPMQNSPDENKNLMVTAHGAW